MSTTFTVNRGIKTSRVHRAKRGAWEADNAIRGKPYTTICVSLPVEYLQAIDELARSRRMSRSALLRNAVLALAEETK